LAHGFLLLFDYSYQASNRRAARRIARVVERFDLPAQIHRFLRLRACSLELEEGEAQIAAILRRNPNVRRLPVAPQEVGGIAECLTPSGDLRTLPCHLWGDNPRRLGLDGFFAARLQRAAYWPRCSPIRM